MTLCLEYARLGSGVPGRWYEDRAALRLEAAAVGRQDFVEALDALPGSSGRSPYWIL
ncbi:hypothetical protein [Brevundimonas sp. GCM10030266]|uniref:hypothetical protein n=1 Tax=Brevundimonas sp. GCM10030266 TaxID=3273386 RepID=UPI0036208779